ncbi:MAG: STAS domain-containing protein [Bacillota bacterium]
MSEKLEFSVVENENSVMISLAGSLDATNAGELLEELKKLIGKQIEKIEFSVSGLEYIASAGLRVIIFTKQKIGKEADIYLISPQYDVKEVVKMSGLDNFIIIEE